MLILRSIRWSVLCFSLSVLGRGLPYSSGPSGRCDHATDAQTSRVHGEVAVALPDSDDVDYSALGDLSQL